MTDRSDVAASLLGRFEDGLLALVVTLLLALSFGQILLRNLFEITFPWTEPLTRHLVLWTGFLGALVATREDKHIRIDVLLRLLPHARRCWAEVVSDLVAAALCGTLSWVAVGFVADERRYGAAGLLGLPTWTLQLIFPLCFGLMTWRYAARATGRIRGLARGGQAQ